MIDLEIEEKTLTLSWIDFKKSGNEIKTLREKVFIEEQGFETYETVSIYDEFGLHLGLYNTNQLVACVSVYLYESEDPYLQKITNNPGNSFALRFTKRVELKGYRAKNYTKMMLAHALRSVYELFQPTLIFATLIGRHIALKNSYIANYGFNREKIINQNTPNELHFLIHDDPIRIKNLYLKLRLYCLENARAIHLTLPDLTAHIFNTPYLTEYLNIEIDTSNRYLEPLSLADELPRLSSQARMLFKGLKNFWEQLLQDHPEKTNIIDLGCGPGIYLSQISKLPQSEKRKFTGYDMSNDFIEYAQFAHPELNWAEASVYDTQLPENSVDIVQASFLFIHLLKPFLALKEIKRILRPGGILVITDINDSTFEGPQPILEMVSAHKNIYEGNREIMSDIISMAAGANFKCIKEEDLLVTNSGSDSVPTFRKNKIDLGKWTLWGLLAFMGQRRETINIFERAESFYIHHNETVSLKIQTRVFITPQ